jgi:hypothetical protein
MKKCKRCQVEKDEKEFNMSKASGHSDGLQSYCKQCVKDYRKDYKDKWPWKLTYRYVHTRCNVPKHDSYEGYGSVGIKNLLTHDLLEKLWYRDRAYEMKKPSIDRIDSKKDYTFDNCRYIEMSKNSAKEHFTYEMRRDIALKSMKATPGKRHPNHTLRSPSGEFFT